jgi:exodeoxyribonuclease III
VTIKADYVEATRGSLVKIATFNVNSIRKRLPIVIDWLKTHQPDVLCLQETKVHDSEFPSMLLKSTGYEVYFRGMKGFNGVATLTKKPPQHVLYGFEEGRDSEDFRFIQVLYNDIPILNTYVPNGHLPGTPKYTYKLQWFQRLENYFKTGFKTTDPVIWLGDLNVAPEPIDVFAPERYANDPCFHIDARNAYKKTLQWGFFDVFRQRYPERVQYTYWDFFRNHFQNNRGWRLDHILTTKPLVSHCKKIEVDLEPRKQPEASDHTVVWAEFDV